ncbi:hypothetical protein SAMN05192529_101283 [Arachidicoccus rhizosphaerae]|uniref:CAAX prenyl protease 2/Lysostaphin resistance protein A-like domain-containing protein n=1 Tax=Arachidicoccus rhizosphaerae TaxID=551991 RepID=A0A1H3VME4_9BACT|nr:CPBP family intramembrane glutamic endopeptidase [Arachidicoccus rhizosphaerae]SDZ75955.1 hypothetical protein SAMN05192529_101283 [Arachidicoccus rhizosphaerae]
MTSLPASKIRISPTGQFFILLGLVCFGLLLSGLISVVMILATPGASLEGITKGDPDMASLARWIQIISTFCMFAGPAFLFKLIIRPGKDYFKFNNKRPLLLWILMLLIAFATIPAADIFTWLNEHIPISGAVKEKFTRMEQTYETQMLYMLELNSWGGFLKSLFLIALLPAMFEELLFRGCLQQVMLSWIKKPFLAILITSIIFSAVHGSYFGFLPRIFIGMVLGYVYYYGRNIFLNMVIHFINNGLIITVMFYKAMTSGDAASALKTQSSAWLAWVGLITLIPLFYYFRQKALATPPSAKSSLDEQPPKPFYS